jgi:hypothetical protein
VNSVQCLCTSGSEGLARANRYCGHDLHRTSPIDRCYPEDDAKRNTGYCRQHVLPTDAMDPMVFESVVESLKLCPSKSPQRTYIRQARRENFYTGEMTKSVSRSITAVIRVTRQYHLTRTEQTHTSRCWSCRSQFCHRHAYAQDENTCNCPLQANRYEIRGQRRCHRLA